MRYSTTLLPLLCGVGLSTDQCQSTYRSLEWSPLRIHSVISGSEADFTKEMIGALGNAVNFLYNVLQVRQVPTGVPVEFGCEGKKARDGTCATPNHFKCDISLEGIWEDAALNQTIVQIDADFVMFARVYKKNEGMCNSDSNLAYAVPCQRDLCGRPVTGTIVICKNGTVSPDRLESILVHEMVHMLAFHTDSLRFFRKPDTLDPRISNQSDEVKYKCSVEEKGITAEWNVPTGDSVFMPLSGIVKASGTDCKCPYSSAKSRTADDIKACITSGGKGCELKLVTEKALAEAIDYFKCPFLDGVPLQVNPGCGSMYTAHWNRDALRGELMEPSSSPDNVLSLSRITLGVLEDSGWYRPDYTLATQPVHGVHWGYQMGCDFVTNPKRDSRIVENINFFCPKKDRFLSDPVCSKSGLGIVKCFTDDINLNQPAYTPVEGGSCLRKSPNHRCLFRAAASNESKGSVALDQPVKPACECRNVKCSDDKKSYQVEFDSEAKSEWKLCGADEQLVQHGSEIFKCADPLIICREWKYWHVASSAINTVPGIGNSVNLPLSLPVVAPVPTDTSPNQGTQKVQKQKNGAARTLMSNTFMIIAVVLALNYFLFTLLVP